MLSPALTRKLEPQEALKVMVGSKKIHETQFTIENQQINLNLARDKMPSNSPYGSWMNLKIPIGSDPLLKKRFQMFDLNTLRIGKLLQIADMLAYDSSMRYLMDFKDAEHTFFMTLAMSGLEF